MEDLLADVLKTAIGAAAGTAFGYLIWLRQRPAELRYAHDSALREQRHRAYARLWRELAPLAVFFPDSDLDASHLCQLGRALTCWYYDDGLLLSARAFALYILLQRGLTVVGTYEPSAATSTSGDKDRGSTGKVEHAAYILRSRSAPTADVISGGDAEVAARLSQVRPLTVAVLRNDWVFKSWHRSVKLTVDRWKPGNPSADFLLLQRLASSMRTLLTADLNTRESSLLDFAPGRYGPPL